MGAYVDPEKAKEAKKILARSGATLTDLIRGVIDGIIDGSIAVEKEIKIKKQS